jgi:hypothetical protein
MKFGNYLLEGTQKVANTILAQINAQDKYALTSWGTKNKVSSESGIQFDVKGSKHRGRVVIALDKGRDLYNIEIGKVVPGPKWKSIKKVSGIDVENLVKTLDGLIG